MNEIYNKHKIYIKLMISLKVDHSHKLPCHPTKNYIEEQMSIYETDR